MKTALENILDFEGGEEFIRFNIFFFRQ